MISGGKSTITVDNHVDLSVPSIPRQLVSEKGPDRVRCIFGATIDTERE